MSSKFDIENFIVFDLETTGIDVKTAKIVTVAFVEVNNGNTSSDERLVDPGIEIPELAASIHGITTEHAREHGENHDLVLRETVERIRKAWKEGKTVVAYNASYDLSVLHFLTNRDFVIEGAVFDPYITDRKLDKWRKGKRKLTNLCKLYGITIENAHNSECDAIATKELAVKMMEKHSKIRDMSLDELMIYQKGAHSDFIYGLKSWYESKGMDSSGLYPGWPIQES